MVDLVAKHGVELAMVNEAWIREVPQEWVNIARLVVVDAKIGDSRKAVVLYVTQPALVPAILSRVEAAGQRLPRSAQLILDSRLGAR
jgi:hypothetical protein